MLVLDRINAIAYVSLSDRADRVGAGSAVASCLLPWLQIGGQPPRNIPFVDTSSQLDVFDILHMQSIAERWVDELGYRDLVTFHSTDAAVCVTNMLPIASAFHCLSECLADAVECSTFMGGQHERPS